MPGIEVMGAGTAGMAVDLHEGAASFSCQAGSGLFQSTADAVASGFVVDGEIADPGEVAFECYLGYKV